MLFYHFHLISNPFDRSVHIEFFEQYSQTYVLYVRRSYTHTYDKKFCCISSIFLSVKFRYQIQNLRVFSDDMMITIMISFFIRPVICIAKDYQFTKNNWRRRFKFFSLFLFCSLFYFILFFLQFLCLYSFLYDFCSRYFIESLPKWIKFLLYIL